MLPKISGSGLNVVVARARAGRFAHAGHRRDRRATFVFLLIYGPPRPTSTSHHSLRKFTALMPTPCNPPEVLINTSCANLPPSVDVRHHDLAASRRPDSGCVLDRDAAAVVGDGATDRRS